jgi:hypothetical protein
MVKAHQLVGAESERRVRLTRVVAELNLVHAWPKALDDSADLSPQQPSFRDILEQGNHREHLDFSHCDCKPHLNNRKQLFVALQQAFSSASSAPDRASSFGEISIVGRVAIMDGASPDIVRKRGPKISLRTSTTCRAHSGTISQGLTCQIWEAYSRMVRSDENFPARATFRIAFLIHPLRSR